MIMLRKLLNCLWLLLLLTSITSQSLAADTNPDRDITDEMRNENGNMVINEDAAIPDNFFSGPREGDLALEMYRQLLGDAAYKATAFLDEDLSHLADPNSNKITLVTYMMSIISVIGIIVGTIMVSYWLVFGLLRQNVEGEFFGKKWDTVFVPVRMLVSFIGMQPHPTFGGLSFIQVIVLACALFGVGMGSALLGGVTEFTYSNLAVSKAKPDYRGFVKSMLASKLCDAYHLKRGAYTLRNGGGIRSTNRWETTQNSHTVQVQSRYEKFVIGKGAICGEFEYLTDVVNSRYPDYITWERDKVIKEINAGMKPLIMSLWNDLDSVLTNGGVRFVDKDTINDLSANDLSQRLTSLHNASTAFEIAVDANVQAALDGLTESEAHLRFIEQVKTFGFAYAGSIHFPIAMRQAVLEGAVSNFLVAPAIDSPGVFTSWLPWNSYFEEYEKLQGQMDKLVKLWLETRIDSYDYVAGTDLIASIQIGQDLKALNSGVDLWVAKWVVNSFRQKEGMPDPLIEAVVIGRRIEDLGFAIMLLRSTVSAAGEGTAIGPFAAIKGFLMPWLELLGVIINLLIGLGIFYAEILPALPYIMFQMALAGYFIYALGVLYASPLWFAQFANPDGDDAFGHGKSGLPILLTLVLKPVLMVMGLFTGLALLKVLGWVIDVTFWPMIMSIHGTGGWMILKLIGKLILYGLVMGLTIYKCNTLTWELPSLVNHMMGLGNTHSDMGENEAHQKTLILGGMLSQNISQMGKKASQPTGGGEEKPSLSDNKKE
ncbi:MAG: DotA/TraY family protein [Endozoicomonadaceae bacterium]|nr:DotA/TraY family protein [Endozoicomonadaceae bacterium]